MRQRYHIGCDDEVFGVTSSLDRSLFSLDPVVLRRPLTTLFGVMRMRALQVAA